MKKIMSIKFILSMMAVMAFMLVIKSCKKTDNSTVNSKSAEASKAAAIKAIKDKYGNVSAGIVFNVNKTANEYYYKDATGKMVSFNSSNGKMPNGISRPCLTCNNAPTAGDLVVTFTLNYVQRLYICESNDKSTLTANWTVSLPFTPAYFSAFSLPNTWGYMQIIAPGGGSPLTHTSYANVSPYDFEMKYLGTDPTCTNNGLYEVTYFFEQVPDSYFGSGTQISGSLSIEGTCSILGGVVTSGSVNAPTLSNNSYLPCNRVDKVFILPPVSGGTYSTANGVHVTCSYPSGWQAIDYHEVEYRLVTSSTSLLWDDQITGSTVHWGEPVSTTGEVPTLTTNGQSNLKLMTAGSGTWLIRYRNVKTSVCDIIYSGGSNPGGIWGSEFTWVTEVLTP